MFKEDLQIAALNCTKSAASKYEKKLQRRATIFYFFCQKKATKHTTGFGKRIRVIAQWLFSKHLCKIFLSEKATTRCVFGYALQLVERLHRANVTIKTRFECERSLKEEK